MVALLLLNACIERITDVAVPLDPRFYAGGGDAANPSGAAGQLGVPWDGVSGERTDVTFVLSGTEAGTVQLDVTTPNAKSAGGVERIGRLESTEPSLTLSVPAAVKTFTVEIFQDPGQDGPSADDPYATLEVDMAALPAGPIPVALVVGARPAAVGGAAGGGGGAVEPWTGVTGDKVEFAAVIFSDAEGEVQVDVAVPDPSQPGGQARVGQLRLPVPGAFTLQVPTSVASFRLEAFQDQAGDGPDQTDPYAELTVQVASIGTEPVPLTLVAGSRGAAGSGGSGPGPGDAGAGGGPAPEPWADHTGSKRSLKVTIVVPAAGEVQVDVNEPDAQAKGGQRRVGERRLQGSGDFTLQVPESVASFKLEAFQDPGHDGPSESDPYAERTVGAADFAGGVTLTLVAGSRGRPGQPAPAPAAPAEAAPAPDTVLLSGKVTAASAGLVVVDIFEAGAAGGKARKHLYKVEAVEGVWTVRVPKNLGAIEVDAYQDPGKDGPGRDDPQGRYASTLVVEAKDVTGIDLALK